jgi:hypothetical protein
MDGHLGHLAESTVPPQKNCLPGPPQLHGLQHRQAKLYLGQISIEQLATELSVMITLSIARFLRFGPSKRHEPFNSSLDGMTIGDWFGQAAHNIETSRKEAA